MERIEQHEPDRNEVIFVLERALQHLEFEETDTMRGLREVIVESMNQDDGATALLAYSRYQELGQEAVERALNPIQANLALNIACAQLLAERNQRDRCMEALVECIEEADQNGYKHTQKMIERLL